jgi:putative DNA primase/helicase
LGDDIIAVPNGLLNLREGVLKPCRPEDYITRRLDIHYDPLADCPVFRRVLSDAFDGDEALINYFTGLIGYWLTGFTDRQECYVLHGEGANGKSTIINAINHVLDGYAETLMAETIFETQRGAHSSDLASMRGKRLGVVHEAESRFRLNAPLIKQITGGDLIKTRALYCNPVSFRPKFKITILCNKRPDLDAHDGALKRRIKLIPFEKVIPRESRDPKLGEKLRNEAPGILNLMVQGAQRYFRDEILEPEAVRKATRSYFGDKDSVSSFLKEATIRKPGATISKGDLYESYSAYCAEEAMVAVSKGEFGGVLKKTGYEDTRTGTERRWRGIKLRDSNEPWAGASDGKMWM